MFYIKKKLKKKHALSSIISFPAYTTYTLVKCQSMRTLFNGFAGSWDIFYYKYIRYKGDIVMYVQTPTPPLHHTTISNIYFQCNINLLVKKYRILKKRFRYIKKKIKNNVNKFSYSYVCIMYICSIL